MRKFISIFFLLPSIFVLPACHKAIEPEFPLFIVLDGHLTDGPWRFISGTSNYSNGIQSRYIGSPLDSVIFQLSANGNLSLSPSTVESSINGVKSTGNWAHPSGYTLTISPPWGNGLSDTVLCTSISDYLMVFKIKKVTATGEGYEIDSLKKIRFWHP
jgi:hypothetical protein